MLLSAVSVLVVAQSIFEISEGLMNNPVPPAILLLFRVLSIALSNLHATFTLKEFVLKPYCSSTNMLIYSSVY